MKLNTNNYKYKELIRWYKKPINSTLKRTINDQISKLKKHIVGNNVLFIGLSDFSKKFTSPKNMSFISSEIKKIHISKTVLSQLG